MAEAIALKQREWLREQQRDALAFVGASTPPALRLSLEDSVLATHSQQRNTVAAGCDEVLR
jgi:hypothetical protein